MCIKGFELGHRLEVVEEFDTKCRLPLCKRGASRNDRQRPALLIVSSPLEFGKILRPFGSSVRGSRSPLPEFHPGILCPLVLRWVSVLYYKQGVGETMVVIT